MNTYCEGVVFELPDVLSVSVPLLRMPFVLRLGISVLHLTSESDAKAWKQIRSYNAKKPVYSGHRSTLIVFSIVLVNAH